MTEGFFKTPGNRVLGSFALLMAIIAMGSYALLNFEMKKYADPTAMTISVSGEGEVVTVPDVGRFSFSVQAEGDTASAAQEESGTRVNEILAYLAEQGVEEGDIKTEFYNMYPRWRYEKRICPANAYCPPGERVQDGFEVIQNVSVKVRNIDEAGVIIAGVGERGATNLSGLDFTIDDTSKLQEEARAKAIADAQEKAGVLAQQLGVRIVRMVSYYEEGGGRDYAVFESRAMAMDMEDGGFVGPELPVGEETTNARVNVTYEVR
mgnify:CR=1 FL=1